jgi:hypothetical protein
MRYRYVLALIAISVCTPSNADECLKDGQAVSFEGRVSRETFPGPPNYQSIDDGDQPETVWILTVDKAYCVTAESMEDGSTYEVAKSTTRFQLAFEDSSVYEKQRALVEQRAVVSGLLFAGHTGHHHTKALVSVKTIKAADAKKKQ